ncbi:MAG: signal peptidase I, partial [Bacilli bacterium]|nr:signal peptidase I [Bacilli bacterium]
MKKQGNRLVTIIGIILCVLLLPILIINITLITKSYTNKDDVPSVMGYYPMIVLTDSMNPVIKSGDLIIGKVVSASDIKKNDIISFFDPDGDGNSVVTHRVVEILNDGGNLQFRTKGDVNNTFDTLLVDSSDVVGVYSTKISGAGNVAMFM